MTIRFRPVWCSFWTVCSVGSGLLYGWLFWWPLGVLLAVAGLLTFVVPYLGEK